MTVAAVAADLGIAANQLHRWRRKHAENGADAFPGDGKINSRDEELHHLRSELWGVTEERDILKNRLRARSTSHASPVVLHLEHIGGLRIFDQRDGTIAVVKNNSVHELAHRDNTIAT